MTNLGVPTVKRKVTINNSSINVRKEMIKSGDESFSHLIMVG